MITCLKRGKCILLLVLLTSSGNLSAQVNDYTFGIGAGAGVNVGFTDLKEQKWSNSYYLKAYYYFTPYITGDLEVQSGHIRGGNRVTNTHLREFSNRYFQVSANGKIFMGKFINNFGDLAFLIRGINLGLGVGVISNNMQYVVRVKPDGSNYVFPGKDKSMNLSIPVNLGYDIHLFSVEDNDRLMVGLNWQHNVTIGEGLDGYNDPSGKFVNNFPDMFSVFTIGVKYNFGGSGGINSGFRRRR